MTDDLLRPLADRVLLRPDPKPTRVTPLRGVTVRVDGGDDGPGACRALVLATGPDASTVAVGDRVVYGQYTGQELGGGRLLVRVGEILAVEVPQ